MEKTFTRSKQGLENYIVSEIREHAYPLKNDSDLTPLIDRIGNARYVLLGEASHGTHEYYTWRAKITKQLIEEKGFSFIGVEGDWPDCYQVNRYIKNYPDTEKSAFDVLHKFNRWPTWMWGNWETVALAEWIKKHNDPLPIHQKAGFYGLDVYSLGESLDAILDYLQKTDRKAYKSALEAIQCFEPYGFEGSDYARSTQLVPKTCEREVVDLLKDIRSNIMHYNTDYEMVFSTEQNALIAVHAENYYREMVKGGPKSWNIRDQHMVETLNRLMDLHGTEAKAIIWEHNTHIGDARATDMVEHGMVNVGEMVTMEHGHEGVVKVGFGSYEGSVIAGRSWGDVMRKMHVPPGIDGSWEFLLHRASPDNKLIVLDKWKDDYLFDQPIGHRAIGVVYHPELEHIGNYVPSILPYRYDAFIYIDKTTALNPLHIQPQEHQIPETYPWGV